MRRLFFTLGLAISFYSMDAQKFFSGNGDYSVLLNENVISKHLDTENDGFIDSYVLRKDGFLYMLSIIKLKPISLTQETIYTKEYKQLYLAECTCKIVESTKVDFKNLSGIRFTIEAELNGARIKGFTVSTVSSSVLFTINFLTEESKFNSFATEYEKIMDSLRFR